MSRLPQNGPQPDAAALAYSEQLVAEITAGIVAQEPLYFDEYMQRALYHPQLGYYSSGRVGFGAGGDFVTAPELSPLFGATLARPTAAVLAQCGGSVLELGAGSGALAISVLDELDRLGELPGEYLILETSAALAGRQRQRIADETPQWLDRIRWLDHWPKDFRGMLLANEVLDAMPVARFRITADGPRELGVDCAGGQLVEIELPARDELREALATIETDLGRVLPRGYCSEINLQLAGWMRGLSDCLVRGAALLIDYGYPRREYYAGERFDGTLRGYYRQHAFDAPLRWPGLCDITAHVDFSAAALAAQEAGLTHEGFAPQAAFLLDCGIAELADTALQTADEVGRLRVAQQLRQLSLPGEMGERFRVLGLSRDLPQPLPGFAGVDLSARL